MEKDLREKRPFCKQIRFRRKFSMKLCDSMALIAFIVDHNAPFIRFLILFSDKNCLFHLVNFFFMILVRENVNKMTKSRVYSIPLTKHNWTTEISWRSIEAEWTVRPKCMLRERGILGDLREESLHFWEHDGDFGWFRDDFWVRWAEVVRGRLNFTVVDLENMEFYWFEMFCIDY